MVWDSAFDAAWQHSLDRLARYRACCGHARVPVSYADPDGYRLGTWLASQRLDHRRGFLSPGRVAALEQLGVIWAAGDTAWDEGITHLARFRDLLGHARVPAAYADPGDGYPVGSWVARQRSRRRRPFAGQVRHVLYPLMSRAGRHRADAELAAVTRATPADGALVHTDLGGANLLRATAASVPGLTGVLDWDQARIGDQAADLASIAVTIGWPLAERIDTRRRGARKMLADARIIAATSALQQALPAALSGDQASVDDGLRRYR